MPAAIGADICRMCPAIDFSVRSFMETSSRPNDLAANDFVAEDYVFFKPAASRARASMPAQSPAASIDCGATQDPPTQTTLGSARYSGAVARVIPPVGQKSTSGKGAP